jgi:hypothetical protein
MSEERAALYRDAEKLPETLEIRHPNGQSTSDWLRSPPTS